jgi:hypothetical protein
MDSRRIAKIRVEPIEEVKLATTASAAKRSVKR